MLLVSIYILRNNRNIKSISMLCRHWRFLFTSYPSIFNLKFEFYNSEIQNLKSPLTSRLKSFDLYPVVYLFNWELRCNVNFLCKYSNTMYLLSFAGIHFFLYWHWYSRNASWQHVHPENLELRVVMFARQIHLAKMLLFSVNR